MPNGPTPTEAAMGLSPRPPESQGARPRSGRSRRREEYLARMHDDTYLELQRSVAKGREQMRAQRNGVLRFVSGIIEPFANQRTIDRAYRAIQDNPNLRGSERILSVDFVREVSRTALGRWRIGESRLQESIAQQQGVGRSLAELRNVASGGQEAMQRICSNSPEVQSFSHDIARDVLLPELRPSSTDARTPEQKLEGYTRAIMQRAAERGQAITQQDARNLAQGFMVVASEMRRSVPMHDIQSPQMEKAFDSMLQRDLDPQQRALLQQLAVISRRRAFIFDMMQGKSIGVVGLGLLHVPPVAAGAMFVGAVAGTAVSSYYRLRFQEVMHTIDVARGQARPAGDRGLLARVFTVDWDRVASGESRRGLQYAKAIAANTALTALFFEAGRIIGGHDDIGDIIRGVQHLFGGRGGEHTASSLQQLAQTGLPGKDGGLQAHGVPQTQSQINWGEAGKDLQQAVNDITSGNSALTLDAAQNVGGMLAHGAMGAVDVIQDNVHIGGPDLSHGFAGVGHWLGYDAPWHGIGAGIHHEHLIGNGDQIYSLDGKHGVTIHGLPDGTHLIPTAKGSTTYEWIVDGTHPPRILAYDVHIDSASNFAHGGHIQLDAHLAIPANQLHGIPTDVQNWHLQGHEAMGSVQGSGNNLNFDFGHASLGKDHDFSWFGSLNKDQLMAMDHIVVNPKLPFVMQLNGNTDFNVVGGYGVLVDHAHNTVVGAIDLHAINDHIGNLNKLYAGSMPVPHGSTIPYVDLSNQHIPYTTESSGQLFTALRHINPRDIHNLPVHTPTGSAGQEFSHDYATNIGKNHPLDGMYYRQQANPAYLPNGGRTTEYDGYRHVMDFTQQNSLPGIQTASNPPSVSPLDFTHNMPAGLAVTIAGGVIAGALLADKENKKKIWGGGLGAGGVALTVASGFFPGATIALGIGGAAAFGARMFMQHRQAGGGGGQPKQPGGGIFGRFRKKKPPVVTQPTTPLNLPPHNNVTLPITPPLAQAIQRNNAGGVAQAVNQANQVPTGQQPGPNTPPQITQQEAAQVLTAATGAFQRQNPNIQPGQQPQMHYEEAAHDIVSHTQGIDLARNRALAEVAARRLLNTTDEGQIAFAADAIQRAAIIQQEQGKIPQGQQQNTQAQQKAVNEALRRISTEVDATTGQNNQEQVALLEATALRYGLMPASAPNRQGVTGTLEEQAVEARINQAFRAQNPAPTAQVRAIVAVAAHPTHNMYTQQQLDQDPKLRAQVAQARAGAALQAARMKLGKNHATPQGEIDAITQSLSSAYENVHYLGNDANERMQAIVGAMRQQQPSATFEQQVQATILLSPDNDEKVANASALVSAQTVQVANNQQIRRVDSEQLYQAVNALHAVGVPDDIIRDGLDTAIGQTAQGARRNLYRSYQRATVEAVLDASNTPLDKMQAGLAELGQNPNANEVAEYILGCQMAGLTPPTAEIHQLVAGLSHLSVADRTNIGRLLLNNLPQSMSPDERIAFALAATGIETPQGTPYTQVQQRAIAAMGIEVQRYIGTLPQQQQNINLPDILNTAFGLDAAARAGVAKEAADQLVQQGATFISTVESALRMVATGNTSLDELWQIASQIGSLNNLPTRGNNDFDTLETNLRSTILPQTGGLDRRAILRAAFVSAATRSKDVIDALVPGSTAEGRAQIIQGLTAAGEKDKAIREAMNTSNLSLSAAERASIADEICQLPNLTPEQKARLAVLATTPRLVAGNNPQDRVEELVSVVQRLLQQRNNIGADIVRNAMTLLEFSPQEQQVIIEGALPLILGQLPSTVDKNNRKDVVDRINEGIQTAMAAAGIPSPAVNKKPVINGITSAITNQKITLPKGQQQQGNRQGVADIDVGELIIR